MRFQYDSLFNLKAVRTRTSWIECRNTLLLKHFRSLIKFRTTYWHTLYKPMCIHLLNCFVLGRYWVGDQKKILQVPQGNILFFLFNKLQRVSAIFCPPQICVVSNLRVIAFFLVVIVQGQRIFNLKQRTFDANAFVEHQKQNRGGTGMEVGLKWNQSGTYKSINGLPKTLRFILFKSLLFRAFIKWNVLLIVYQYFLTINLRMRIKWTLLNLRKTVN